MIGHRIMGTPCCARETSRKAGTSTIRRSRFTILPSIVRWRRVLAQDTRVAILSFRSLALWLLGYPEAALADADHALNDAREIGQAATLMFALAHASLTYIYCGNYATANALIDELVALADEKGAVFWKAVGMLCQGCVICPDRQSLGRSPNDHLRDHRIAVNGINTV